MKKKISIFVGTRPEIIKVSTLSKVLSYDFDIDLIFTGQHKETAEVLFDFLELKPSHTLNVLKKNQSLSELSARATLQIEEYLKSSKTNMVLVQGDTTTAFISSLVSFYNKIPVAHIEAGLRTHDMYSPFPEEINRKLISSIASLNFCPTKKSHSNLKEEGIDINSSFVTGNTVIDTLLESKKKIETLPDDYFSITKNFSKFKKIVLVTCHRRENFGKPLLNIIAALKNLSNTNEDTLFVLPVHPNPNVKKIVEHNLGNIPNFQLTDPLSYQELLYVMSKSFLILSDSGGIQEEAPSLNVPVLVLRESTERPEGIENENAILVGSSFEKITNIFNTLIKDKKLYGKMSNALNPYGNGDASKKISLIIKEFLNG